MQRVRLSVDIEDEKFLTEEIEEKIANVVRSRTREYFQDTIEKELSSACEKKYKSLFAGTKSFGDRRIDIIAKSAMTSAIRDKVCENFQVSEADIQKETHNILRKIISEHFAEAEDLDTYISRKVEEAVQQRDSEIHMSSEDKQKIAEMQTEIDRLRSENEALRKRII